MSYDAKCYELAEYFLPEATPEQRQKLAQFTQDLVEDWILFDKEETLERATAKAEEPE